MSTICITHSRDLDGHCSGAIVKKAIPDAEIIGYDYGESFPWDKVKGNEVIMVDVSLPMPEMSRLAMEANEFTWIDHHKSAIDEYYKCLKEDMEFIEAENVSLKIGKAACELAWEYFFPKDLMPTAVFLLGTYDVWRNKDKNYWDQKVMPFQYGMRLQCSSSDTFPMLLLDDKGNCQDIIQYGNMILKYQETQNKGMMKASFQATVAGYSALCCNVGLPAFNSQTFKSVYLDRYDIMVPFCYLGPGLGYRVSFYTESEHIDCSLVAKEFGGGGHKGAAGCQVRDISEVISVVGSLQETRQKLLQATENLGHPLYGQSYSTTEGIDKLRNDLFDFLGIK